MPEFDDPIPPDQAATMAVIIDHIEPDQQVTAAQLHRSLAAEMTDPPSLADVENALAILAMPRVEFRPGESSSVVLNRMRDMLADAEAPSEPPPSTYYRY